MGVKLQTTESFIEKVYRKYGDKVEILSEYNGGTKPIDFIYWCEIHGETQKTINAKNVLAVHFSPCKQCTSINHSDSGQDLRKKDPDYFYQRLKIFCSNKGGVLVSKEWIKSKTIYEVDCGNEDHPNFFNSADKLENSDQWCPYCYGRKGNFQVEIEGIVNAKNGKVLGEYDGANSHVSLKCNAHNYIWEMMPLNIRKGRWSPVCSLPYSEIVPYEYLVNNNYRVRVQYEFKDLYGENNQPLRFDLGILDKYDNLLGLIEIDDERHWRTTKNIKEINAQQRDIVKNDYCKNNNIKLFRMKYFKSKKEFKDYDWYYKYIGKQLNNFLTEIINIKIA